MVPGTGMEKYNFNVRRRDKVRVSSGRGDGVAKAGNNDEYLYYGMVLGATPYGVCVTYLHTNHHLLLPVTVECRRLCTQVLFRFHSSKVLEAIIVYVIFVPPHRKE